jgi:hypothetical protein
VFDHIFKLHESKPPSPQKHPGAPHTSADSTWPPSRPLKAHIVIYDFG